MAGSAVPSSMATGNTRLPDTHAQAPIGSWALHSLPVEGMSQYSSLRCTSPQWVQLGSLHLKARAAYFDCVFSNSRKGSDMLRLSVYTKNTNSHTAKIHTSNTLCNKPLKEIRR